MRRLFRGINGRLLLIALVAVLALAGLGAAVAQGAVAQPMGAA